MKVVRSEAPVTVIGRTVKQIMFAIGVDLEWQEKRNRWMVLVTDYEVINVETPLPGAPLKNYIPIRQPDGRYFKEVIRTPQEVDDLFNYFAVDIIKGDSLTEKIRMLIAKSVILDTQQKPIYDINPAELIIVDTELEIQPAV